MKLKLCSASLFLLTACQLPLATNNTSPQAEKFLSAAKPVILAEPSPGVPLPEIKTDIGPKSTGPKPTAVSEIVDFFQTLQLENTQTHPALMTQLQLSMSANKVIKPVYFTIMATLANGDKAEVFRAQLNAEGNYIYSLDDLKQIQGWLGRLQNIQSLEFVFYADLPSSSLTPIANVTPKIAKRSDDDYSLDVEIDDEDEPDFHEDEDEGEDDDSSDDKTEETEDESKSQNETNNEDSSDDSEKESVGEPDESSDQDSDQDSNSLEDSEDELDQSTQSEDDSSDSEDEPDQSTQSEDDSSDSNDDDSQSSNSGHTHGKD